ncbi:MAG TPA: CerR family C-terminal domain-containing protein [Planctomycetota bacterium]|jgi:AcrR family transcriptional regulator
MAEQPDTRQRLLEAGGEVFAARGFQDATIREICHRASANVAAVNYHFRDKASLYAAVLRYTFERAREKFPLEPNRDRAPEERLRLYIHSFLMRILGVGRPAWHGRLAVREVVDPTPALDSIINDIFRPSFALLQEIVRNLLGPGATEKAIHHAAASISGQCLFYAHSRAVIERMTANADYSQQMIDDVAAHITAFSLGALKAMAAANPGGEARSAT